MTFPYLSLDDIDDCLEELQEDDDLGDELENEKFEQSSGVPQALSWYESQLLGATSDLVVAPETAVPLLLQDLPAGYWDRLSTGLRTTGHAAIFGIPLGDNQQGFTNSVIGFMPSNSQLQRYDLPD
jgi:apolipoprotein N-acyltransferase